MISLKAAADVLCKILEWVVAACFTVILVLTILLVVLRYGFNESIIGGNELIEQLFIYTTAIGAAVAVARKEHIKISWFADKLAPLFRKIVDIIVYLLIALVNAVMIYYSVPWIRTVGKFKSPVLRIPNRFIQIAVPIGCGLVILYCLFHILIELFQREPKLGKESASC